MNRAEEDVFGLKSYLGASDGVIKGLYTPIANKHLKNGHRDAQGAILRRLANGLFRRRQYVLPDGVEAEMHHRGKGLWEFIVFLAGFKGTAEEPGVKHVDDLISPLSNRDISWIKGEREAFEALSAFYQGDYNANPNSQRLAQIYGLISDELFLEQDDEKVSHTDDSPVLIEEQSPQKPDGTKEEAPKKMTLKQHGRVILDWLEELSCKNVDWVFQKEECLFVMTPLAFQRYEKHKQMPWQRAQKALLKLNIHKVNEASKLPFIQEGKANYVVIPLNHFERS